MAINDIVKGLIGAGVGYGVAKYVLASANPLVYAAYSVLGYAIGPKIKYSGSGKSPHAPAH